MLLDVKKEKPLISYDQNVTERQKKPSMEEEGLYIGSVYLLFRGCLLMLTCATFSARELHGQ